MQVHERIDAFLSELRLLQIKWGLELGSYDEMQIADTTLDGDTVADYVDLKRRTYEITNDYSYGPRRYVPPHDPSPVGSIGHLSETLKQVYLPFVKERLNEPAGIWGKLTKY